ncbi:MAG TPA: hypothetical protein VMC02_01270, partial [Steroidobacteraceae bacterium]|nr:hypothetical protein [Steroidobacteraceae bacterium]
SRAKIGELAQVSLPSSPDPLTARVREIAPAADPQTRTLRIRLQLDAPPPGLKLGTLGEVTLLPTTAAPAGIDIPATALFHHGTVPAVWVLQGTSPVLALRPVTVQGYRDETVRLSAGLNPGERIVAAGVHTVFAGERVTPFVASFGESAP